MRSVLWAVLAALVWIPGWAQAARVRGVPFNPAVHAALTSDPVTGNTWLGLKWTSGVSEVTGVQPGTQSGMSIAQVLAELGPGGDFEGWRYATYAEVTSLLTGLFGLPAGVSGVFFEPHPHLPAVAAMSNTMDFLYRPEMPGMFANGIPVYLYGTSGVIPSGPSAGLRFDVSQTQWVGHPWDVYIETQGSPVSINDKFSWIGHFLVLDEVPDPCEGVTCGPAPSACHEPGVCNPATGSCEYAQKAPGATCNDGLACTLGNTCDAAGVCGQPSDVACADGIPCTVDACDPALGCTNTPGDAACNTASCPVGGDLNGSGGLNVADIVCLLVIVLSPNGSAPACLLGPPSIADVNCSGGVNVADAQILASLTLLGSLSVALDRNLNACHDTCEVPLCGDGTCDTTAASKESCLLCPEDCGGCTSGSCDAPHAGPGCADVDVQECVCAQLPTCCAEGSDWGAACAALAPQCP
jgi:hypothetical protein